LKIRQQNPKGWGYGGNPQAVVDDACPIIMACDVVIETNDKQQAVPMAEGALANLPAAGMARPRDATGPVQTIVSLEDSGYFSAQAVSGLEALGLDPYLATAQQQQHRPAEASTTAALPATGTATEAMRAKLRTARGRAV
jgi:hypothetical protein